MINNIRKTQLHSLHVENKAYMVDFANYNMPLYYSNLGVTKENLHTRESVSLFDVSHMGQVMISGVDAIKKLSYLVPADLENLKLNHMVYTCFTNKDGGVIDDCIFTKTKEGLFLVINASRKSQDLAHMKSNCPDLDFNLLEEYSLLALQGEKSKDVLSSFGIEVSDMKFMTIKNCSIDGIDIMLSRCGYAGSDGFEISVENTYAEKIARLLLAKKEVQLAGLGARDSLRLEAGLCLYGNELDEKTSPIEAGLSWSIPKNKRNKKAFLGSDKIFAKSDENMMENATKKLVGIELESKVAARTGNVVFLNNSEIGVVTSGTHSPTLKKPICMAFVDKAVQIDDEILVKNNKREMVGKVIKMPFIKHTYYKN